MSTIRDPDIGRSARFISP